MPKMMMIILHGLQLLQSHPNRLQYLAGIASAVDAEISIPTVLESAQDGQCRAGATMPRDEVVLSAVTREAAAKCWTGNLRIEKSTTYLDIFPSERDATISVSVTQLKAVFDHDTWMILVSG